MSINNLAQFLDGFKKKFTQEEDFRANIEFVLKKYAKSQPVIFSVERDVLFIKTSPSVKQVLYLNKQKVLEEINLLVIPRKFSDFK